MKRKKASRLSITLFLFLTCSLIQGGQPAAQQQAGEEQLQAASYHISKAASKIKIDGKLNEIAWEQATRITTFYEWAPGDNTKPPVDTECLVTYDNHHFYIAFRCFDPEPAQIRAHLMDRDAIDTFIQDDHVQVNIDTFNDERRSFQFRVNPLGVQADANCSWIDIYEDFSWNAIWSSAGQITDSGYIVEIAVPFNQLRFPKTDGEQTWGFSASRSYPRSQRHRMNSHPKSRDNDCLACQFNKMTGLEGISPGKSLEFDPTLTINRTDKRVDFPDGDMETGKIHVEPGITGRWGITPNLILSAAANPDFSHVEADVAQLEVNTKFALFYPETRPFFLEGGDYFLDPLTAVFTRTVVDPVWGGKITGKLGKNTIGLMATEDRYNNLIFPANQYSQSTSLEENTFGGVLRFRRDVGKGSNIGVLYTGRVSDEYFNHAAGLDAFIRFSNTKTLLLQYLHTETKYPTGLAQDFNQPSDTFGGNAMYALFNHTGRNWLYKLAYLDSSPGYRSDFGFNPRVDKRFFYSTISRQEWGDKGDWYNFLSLRLTASRLTDYDGNLRGQTLMVSGSYGGPWQSTFGTYYAIRNEYYDGILYDLADFNFLLEIKPTGGLKLLLEVTGGNKIDYSNSRLAGNLQMGEGLELGLGKYLNLNLTHTFQRLSLKGEKIYTANLLQGRLIFNFSVRSFFRVILQYQDIDRNVDLYNFAITPRTKGLFSQLLFSYKINPQTVLYLGYSDNYLGLPGIDITQTDRTFFLKIGYALVL